MKNSISYVWIFENTPNQWKSSACGIINCVDTITPAVMGLYFIYVANWFYLVFAMSCLCLIAYIILMIFYSESAKWLLINGRLEEAI